MKLFIMKDIINTIILFLLVAVIVFISDNCKANTNDLALIKSYDTIYVDVRDTSLLHRQIYINDIYNKKEIYMLYDMKKDSIIKKYEWVQKY